PPEGRQTVVFGATPSGGHVVLVPVQVSGTSQSPADGRHTAPALPAGWVQAGEPTGPLHWSVVHTFPSSVHAVPADLTTSAGQFGPFPGQDAAMSHSFTAARQVKVEGWKGAAGQVELLPVQVSAMSHAPAAARHTVPAGFFASAGQFFFFSSRRRHTRSKRDWSSDVCSSD